MTKCEPAPALDRVTPVALTAPPHPPAASPTVRPGFLQYACRLSALTSISPSRRPLLAHSLLSRDSLSAHDSPPDDVEHTHTATRHGSTNRPGMTARRSTMAHPSLAGTASGFILTTGPM